MNVRQEAPSFLNRLAGLQHYSEFAVSFQPGLCHLGSCFPSHLSVSTRIIRSLCTEREPCAQSQRDLGGLEPGNGEGARCKVLPYNPQLKWLLALRVRQAPKSVCLVQKQQLCKSCKTRLSCEITNSCFGKHRNTARSCCISADPPQPCKKPGPRPQYHMLPKGTMPKGAKVTSEINADNNDQKYGIQSKPTYFCSNLTCKCFFPEWVAKSGKKWRI